MRVPSILRLPALLLVAALAACASGGSGGTASSTGAAGSRHSSDLLTQAEIQDAGVGSTYDIVQRLRPAWLRTRSGGSTRTSPQYAIVYLDGSRIGGLEALRRINSTDVRSIRFLRAGDATTRYGTGHEGGAILVETKK